MLILKIIAVIVGLYLLAFLYLVFMALIIEYTQPTEEDFNRLNAKYNAQEENKM